MLLRLLDAHAFVDQKAGVKRIRCQFEAIDAADRGARLTVELPVDVFEQIRARPARVNPSDGVELEPAMPARNIRLELDVERFVPVHAEERPTAPPAPPAPKEEPQP